METKCKTWLKKINAILAPTSRELALASWELASALSTSGLVNIPAILTNTAVLYTCVSIVCLPVCGAPWWVLLQHCIMMLRVVFMFQCGIVRFLCTMRVFKVWASSSSPDVPNFISLVASIAELAHREKSRTQSLTHPAYLMPPRTEACASE